MKTWFDADARREILDRLNRLTPSHERRWGRMTVQQMICHLCDSARVALGDLPVQFVGNAFTRTALFRAGAFSPLPWPRGVLKTAPEIDQAREGTPPTTLTADRAELVRLLDDVVRRGEQQTAWPDHPIMGAFTREDWGRQIYRHCDHHLKQFGV